MSVTFMPVHLKDVGLGQGGFALLGTVHFGISGTSVASAGDLNRDGYGDLIIGSPDFDIRTEIGEAHVVFGKPGGFGAAITLRDIAQGRGGFVIHGEEERDYFASSVASAGDVNGDGLDDLIIGAFAADGPGNAKPFVGAAYVVFGKSGGLGAAIDIRSIGKGKGGFVIHGEDADDSFGYSVASAGDVNGDGFDDLIIGAPSADGAGNAKPGAGAAYLVFGKAGGFRAGVDLALVAQGQGGFVLHGENPGDGAGRSVALAGDVNGDGFDDLILGASGADIAGPDLGAAYVVFGKAGGLDTAVDLRDIAQGQGGFVILGADGDDNIGFHLAPAGDVNGDGFGDLIIGSFLADGPRNVRPDAGHTHVVFGKAGGFGAAVDLRDIAQGQGGFVIHGENAGDFSGASVASAGDINGDGFDDLIIGAPSADGANNANTKAGDSYVVFGKAEGFGAAIDLRDIAAGRGGFVIHGVDKQDLSGRSVASAGDVNGDGFDDLIIGASAADGPGNGRVNAGESYVIFGGAFQPGPAGSASDDRLLGGVGAQGMEGLAGQDTLRGQAGDDTLAGGEGNDRLNGARGADALSGGAGRDRFRFDDNALGWTDRILDFDRTEGDRIVLRGIDADTATAADDAFAFIGATAFSGTAGELRAEAVDRGTTQRIEGDVDGDGIADLTLDVVTTATAAAAWFVL